MPENACELDDAPCPLSVTKARRGLILNTDFGLAIEFDGDHKLFVSIPKDWGLEVCHFCPAASAAGTLYVVLF